MFAYKPDPLEMINLVQPTIYTVVSSQECSGIINSSLDYAYVAPNYQYILHFQENFVNH